MTRKFYTFMLCLTMTAGITTTTSCSNEDDEINYNTWVEVKKVSALKVAVLSHDSYSVLGDSEVTIWKYGGKKYASRPGKSKMEIQKNDDDFAPVKKYKYRIYYTPNAYYFNM